MSQTTRPRHCECCGGDGGFAEGPSYRWVECRACEGSGLVEVEYEPCTMEEINANG